MPVWAQNFFSGGVKAKDFSGGGYRPSNPHTRPPGIMYEPILRRKRNSEFCYYLDFRPLSGAGTALFGSERHHGDLLYFFHISGYPNSGELHGFTQLKGKQKVGNCLGFVFNCNYSQPKKPTDFQLVQQI